MDDFGSGIFFIVILMLCMVAGAFIAWETVTTDCKTFGMFKFIGEMFDCSLREVVK